MRRIIAITIALGALPAPATAQRVTGQVVASAAGEPVPGAFVALLGADGERLAAFLSDSTGRFFFDVASAGSFVLRAERIGHTTTTATLVLPADSARFVRIVAPPAAIALDAIAIRHEGRCVVRPSAAAAAARVWDEARKSLEIARFTAASSDLTFRSTRYVLDLGPSGDVRSREVRHASSSGQRSFRPVPVEVLDAHGFVVMRGDSINHYAPDADVLLSDSFLDHHCFEAVAGGVDHPGLVGLRFRPVPTRRVPEIEGTIWLDAKSAALVRLDFQYTGTSHFTPVARALGEVHFARTGVGLVYVERWFIRMPIAEQSNGRVSLAGWIEEGGLVQGVSRAR